MWRRRRRVGRANCGEHLQRGELVSEHAVGVYTSRAREQKTAGAVFVTGVFRGNLSSAKRDAGLGPLPPRLRNPDAVS